MSCKNSTPQDRCFSTENIHRVVVIGSGVAGLQVTRALLRAGLAVTCLEQKSDVEGIWTNDMQDCTLQIPWKYYQFPEFPFPDHLKPKAPRAASSELAAYTAAYADNYGLKKHIRFNCKVRTVAWIDTDASQTKRQTHQDHGHEHSHAKAIYTPWLDADLFSGKILHRTQVKDTTTCFKGQYVVIIGNSQTGVDLAAAVACADQAKSVTFVYRTSHWCLPRTLYTRPVHDVLFSRYTASHLPHYYSDMRNGESPAGGVSMASCIPCFGPQTEQQVCGSEFTTHMSNFCDLFGPGQSSFWKNITAKSRPLNRSMKMLKPDLDLFQDLFYGAQVVDSQWQTFLKQGSVKTMKGHVLRMLRDAVVVDNGTVLPCDVVVCCTGFNNTYKWFPDAVLNALQRGRDGMYLYRSIIPLAVPNLAFVGCEVSIFNQMMTTSLQAEWLARVLTGSVHLPSVQAMQADVSAQQQWRRLIMPAARNRVSVYMLFQQHYWDQLVHDMGERVHRKGSPEMFQEHFTAYLPQDYKDVVADMSMTRTAQGQSLRLPAENRLIAVAGNTPAEPRAATKRDKPKPTSRVDHKTKFDRKALLGPILDACYPSVRTRAAISGDALSSLHLQYGHGLKPKDAYVDGEPFTYPGIPLQHNKAHITGACSKDRRCSFTPPVGFGTDLGVGNPQGVAGSSVASEDVRWTAEAIRLAASLANLGWKVEGDENEHDYLIMPVTPKSPCIRAYRAASCSGHTAVKGAAGHCGFSSVDEVSVQMDMARRSAKGLHAATGYFRPELSAMVPAGDRSLSSRPGAHCMRVASSPGVVLENNRSATAVSARKARQGGVGSRLKNQVVLGTNDVDTTQCNTRTATPAVTDDNAASTTEHLEASDRQHFTSHSISNVDDKDMITSSTYGQSAEHELVHNTVRTDSASFISSTTETGAHDDDDDDDDDDVFQHSNARFPSRTLSDKPTHHSGSLHAQHGDVTMFIHARRCQTMKDAASHGAEGRDDGHLHEKRSVAAQLLIKAAEKFQRNSEEIYGEHSGGSSPGSSYRIIIPWSASFHTGMCPGQGL